MDYSQYQQTIEVIKWNTSSTSHNGFRIKWLTISHGRLYHYWRLWNVILNVILDSIPLIALLSGLKRFVSFISGMFKGDQTWTLFHSLLYLGAMFKGPILDSILFTTLSSGLTSRLHSLPWVVSFFYKWDVLGNQSWTLFYSIFYHVVYFIFNETLKGDQSCALLHSLFTELSL